MDELKRRIEWPEIDCSGESSVLGWKTLYPDLQQMRKEEWERRARAYEADPEDFHTAWHWLNNHPVFWYFGKERHERNLCADRGVFEGLEFVPVKVNPETLRIDDDSSKNTLVQIWVEVFMSSLRQPGGGIRLHDVECDTGGATYEEAVVKVAKRIYERYGNDRESLAASWRNA